MGGAAPSPTKGSRVKPSTLLTPALAAGLLAAALSAGPMFAAPSVAATPPPTPPPMNAPATPAAVSTPIPIPSGFAMPGTYSSPAPKGSASPSPPPDARKGIEGVWEVEIQHPDKTDYSHFKLVQSGGTLTGSYLDDAGKRHPLEGSVDGQAVRLVITMPDGTTLLMEGRLDGTTDIIGMLTTPKGQVPFTAAYRPKEKWIDSVNAAPGGMGGMGGAGAGGGYRPPLQ
jgi:hypothetical protein